MFLTETIKGAAETCVYSEVKLGPAAGTTAASSMVIINVTSDQILSLMSPGQIVSYCIIKHIYFFCLLNMYHFFIQ